VGNPVGSPSRQALRGHHKSSGFDRYATPRHDRIDPPASPSASWPHPGGGRALNVRIHDLRHSFASIAVSGGDSLYLVGKVPGHRQSRTTERYAHLRDDPLRAVANRTSERIAAIMQGRSGAKIVPLRSPKAAE
jgi:integrase